VRAAGAPRRPHRPARLRVRRSLRSRLQVRRLESSLDAACRRVGRSAAA